MNHSPRSPFDLTSPSGEVALFAPPPRSHELPEMLSVARVAVVFDRSEGTIRRWLKDGRLTPKRIGRSIFIHPDEVNRLIEIDLTGAIFDRLEHDRGRRT